MGPSESCVDFGPHPQLWFPFMAQQLGFTHPVLFCIYIAESLVSAKPLNKKAHHHLDGALAFINRRLTNPVTAVDDINIVVVLALIDFSAYLGDYRAAAIHLRGLAEMVRLRGGIDAFRPRPRLYAKLARLDLIQALYSGNGPVFQSRPDPSSSGIDHRSVPAGASSFHPASTHVPNMNPSPPLPQWMRNLHLKNPILLTAFCDLKNLVTSLNATAVSENRISGLDFQTEICSIQYRLLYLQDVSPIHSDEKEEDIIVGECLRLGMLAFLVTTFQIPPTFHIPTRTPTVTGSYPFLARRYREACDALWQHAQTQTQTQTQTQDLKSLWLWLLIIGGLIQVFRIDDDDFRSRWRAVVSLEMSWEEARALLLGDVLWIEAIHDRAGERLFQVMNNVKMGGDNMNGDDDDDDDADENTLPNMKTTTTDVAVAKNRNMKAACAPPLWEVGGWVGVTYKLR